MAEINDRLGQNVTHDSWLSDTFLARCRAQRVPLTRSIFDVGKVFHTFRLNTDDEPAAPKRR